MQALFLACIPISSALIGGCLSDVKIHDLSAQGVTLSDANNVHVQLLFRQRDFDLVKFASILGLTVCYDAERGAFLLNATPDFF
jgi:hypothetical protein